MSAVLLYFSLCFTVLQNSLFCNAVTASVDKLQQKQERHMWILSNLLQSISHTRVTLSYDSKCTRQPCSFAVVTIETHTYRVHWYIDSIVKLSCLYATEQGLVPWRHQNVYWDKNLGSFCRLSTVWCRLQERFHGMPSLFYKHQFDLREKWKLQVFAKVRGKLLILGAFLKGFWAINKSSSSKTKIIIKWVNVFIHRPSFI